GIRGFHVTGVQTCALPILPPPVARALVVGPSLRYRAAGPGAGRVAPRPPVAADSPRWAALSARPDDDWWCRPPPACSRPPAVSPTHSAHRRHLPIAAAAARRPISDWETAGRPPDRPEYLQDAWSRLLESDIDRPLEEPARIRPVPAATRPIRASRRARPCRACARRTAGSPAHHRRRRPPGW